MIKYLWIKNQIEKINKNERLKPSISLIFHIHIIPLNTKNVNTNRFYGPLI